MESSPQVIGKEEVNTWSPWSIRIVHAACWRHRFETAFLIPWCTCFRVLLQVIRNIALLRHTVVQHCCRANEIPQNTCDAVRPGINRMKHKKGLIFCSSCHHLSKNILLSKMGIIFPQVSGWNFNKHVPNQIAEVCVKEKLVDSCGFLGLPCDHGEIQRSWVWSDSTPYSPGGMHAKENERPDPSKLMVGNGNGWNLFCDSWPQTEFFPASSQRTRAALEIVPSNFDASPSGRDFYLALSGSCPNTIEEWRSIKIR